MTQRGARLAIHSRARFSAAAVSEWFTRCAATNDTPLVTGPLFVSIIPHLSIVFVQMRLNMRAGYLRKALHVARSVNSSDSRGTLSTNGLITHANPAGTDRDSDTDSICM